MFYWLLSFDVSFVGKAIVKFRRVLNASAWLARTHVGAYLSLHVKKKCATTKRSWQLCVQCTGKVLVSHRSADICWGKRAEEQAQRSCASFCIPPLPGTRPMSVCWLEWVVKSRKTYVVVLNPAQDRRGGSLTETERSFQ